MTGSIGRSEAFGRLRSVAGIARTAKALGGEGTNYLLLKTKQQV